jgi:hypothetical protein
MTMMGIIFHVTGNVIEKSFPKARWTISRRCFHVQARTYMHIHVHTETDAQAYGLS